MWQTESRITIRSTPEDVFTYLADLQRHHEWSCGVARNEQTSGTGIEVGAEFRAEETVPMRFTSFSRITRLEPPSRIEWRSWDNRTFQVDWAFEILPEEGGVILVQRATFQPQNLFGRALLTAMRRRQIPKENAQSLESLKAVLEMCAQIEVAAPRRQSSA